MGRKNKGIEQEKSEGFRISSCVLGGKDETAASRLTEINKVISSIQ